ncbi:MAG: hypothetical protein HRU38_22145 [Saccharospirillaceae bacterium]|nr:hypothetical protein [Pseudomonadales bacterium]NRB81331.1 hypothetical protein [Saccharospirillaceae bacterium]
MELTTSANILYYYVYNGQLAYRVYDSNFGVFVDATYRYSYLYPKGRYFYFTDIKLGLKSTPYFLFTPEFSLKFSFASVDHDVFAFMEVVLTDAKDDDFERINLNIGVHYKI